MCIEPGFGMDMWEGRLIRLQKLALSAVLVFGDELTFAYRFFIDSLQRRADASHEGTHCDERTGTVRGGASLSLRRRSRGQCAMDT